MAKINPFIVPIDDDSADWYDWYRDIYLNTNFWRWRREQYMKLMGWHCENHCGRLGTEIHHLSYKNLYHEPNEELMLLCRLCHQKMHGRSADNDNQPDLFGKPAKRIGIGDD